MLRTTFTKKAAAVSLGIAVIGSLAGPALANTQGSKNNTDRHVAVAAIQQANVDFRQTRQALQRDFKDAVKDARERMQNTRQNVRLAANILIDRTNDVPFANNQTVTVMQNSSVGITLTGSDPEHKALRFEVLNGPSHGILSGNGAKRLYTPTTNFNGNDSFTFRVSDGKLVSTTATVSITVVATPNTAPTARRAIVNTAVNTAAVITLHGADVNGCANTSHSFTVTSTPHFGTLNATSGSATCVNGQLTATVTYAPNANFDGADFFHFRFNDGVSGNAISKIVLIIG